MKWWRREAGQRAVGSRGKESSFVEERVVGMRNGQSVWVWVAGYSRMADVLFRRREAVEECHGGEKDCGRKLRRGLVRRRVVEVAAWWFSLMWMVEWALGGRSRVGQVDSLMWLLR